MSRSIIKCIFFFLATSLISCYNSDRIYLKEGYYYMKRPLAWSDFQGDREECKNDSLRNGVALSHIDIVVIEEPIADNGIKNISIFAGFNPSRSWVKDGHDNDINLTHEQGHYDIALIYAEILKNDLSSVENTDENEAVLNGLITDVKSDYWDMQRNYDLESNYDSYAQARWNSRINFLMDSLGIKY